MSAIPVAFRVCYVVPQKRRPPGNTVTNPLLVPAMVGG
jgi:hypothetical protein